MLKTAEQESILQALLTSEDNLMLEAGPGCGKTFTSIWLNQEYSEHFPSARTLFCAFNKSIAEETQRKLGDKGTAKTLHSLGFQVLRNNRGRVQVKDTTLSLIKRLSALAAEDEDFLWETKEEIDHRKSHLESSPFSSPQAKELADRVLEVQEAGTGEISFDDMLWLPVAKGWRYPAPIDLLFVDEAQDLNPVQHAFIKKVLRPKRIVLVGDPFQSIYAFRGAVQSSMATFAAEGSWKKLPLLTSFRLPHEVVARARDINPELRAFKGNPPGEVRTGDLELSEKETLVMCRNNAPLFYLAMKLLRQRVPFNFLNPWGERFLKEVIKASKGDKSLREWCAIKCQAAEKKYSGRAAESIKEKYETLAVLGDDWGQALETLKEILKPKNANLTLSSIHKAKGLEAEEVYLLRPDLIPSKYALNDDEIAEEWRCWYVAITRAKRRFTFVI